MSETRVSEQAIRYQLDRILASESFSRSERLATFLRFAVIETIQGRGHTLKEQVIAVSLYQRAESYAEDGSAVRADARRLRDKLREYYCEFPAEPVIISLQKGSYTPGFTRNGALETTSSPAMQETAAAPRPANPKLVIITAAVVITVILTAVAILRSMTDAASPPPRITPLTLDAGGEGMPSLSPDGNFVAYQHWDPPGPSAQDIWIKAVNSESRRRLTDTPHPIAEQSPAWSPDGTEIVFERVGFGKPYIPEQGIFIISVLGGPERQISGSGRNPRWTADGRSVLIRDGIPFAIIQVDLATRARRPVTKPPAGDDDQRFDVSPDGKTLAFIRSKRSGAADIYVVPMTGGEPRQLTSWSRSMTGLTWTADGHDLIYDSTLRQATRVPGSLTRCCI